MRHKTSSFPRNTFYRNKNETTCSNILDNIVYSVQFQENRIEVTEEYSGNYTSWEKNPYQTKDGGATNRHTLEKSNIELYEPH